MPHSVTMSRQHYRGLVVPCHAEGHDGTSGPCRPIGGGGVARKQDVPPLSLTARILAARCSATAGHLSHANAPPPTACYSTAAADAPLMPP